MLIDTIKNITEAAKKKKKASTAKPIDPNEENAKMRRLRHRVGNIVHAGLAVKGGAGYRGEVVKIEKNHTYINIGNKRIVKAPHHLVSIHEEDLPEETKAERKSRLAREAEIATKSARKYQDVENKLEGRDERSKRRHEHARKLHWEETVPNSEARKKESLIGRPNDPPVNSKKNILHKTQQIMTKILDGDE